MSLSEREVKEALAMIEEVQRWNNGLISQDEFDLGMLIDSMPVERELFLE